MYDGKETAMQKNIVIWGYGFCGAKAYMELRKDKNYCIVGFGDNNENKSKYKANEMPIYSISEMIKLKEKLDYSVIIAAGAWAMIGKQLESAEIAIEGIYCEQGLKQYKQMHFTDLDLNKDIFLYAGNICDEIHLSQENLYGLSITKGDERHILHDITEKYPLPDESIAAYQAEDVLEHIAFEQMVSVINEIYRILKRGSVFRICLPDYNSDLLSSLAMRDEYDNIIFDPLGGGDYSCNGVVKGGHVWFPKYDIVKDLLEKTKFTDIRFLCYHTDDKQLILHEIDSRNGYVRRVQNGEEVFSMVIDCYK